MSLNNIRLPGSAVAALFTNSLVEDRTSSPAPRKREESSAPPLSAAPTAAWKKLGNNQKQIVIAVSYPNSVHLPDEELSFLTTMLAACKLSLDDVAVINLNNYPDKTYKPIIDHFDAQKVLLFGVPPSTLSMPVDFPTYQVQSFAGTTYLYAQALEERLRDQLYKSRLWVCLRTLFNI